MIAQPKQISYDDQPMTAPVIARPIVNTLPKPAPVGPAPIVPDTPLPAPPRVPTPSAAPIDQGPYASPAAAPAPAAIAPAPAPAAPAAAPPAAAAESTALFAPRIKPETTQLSQDLPTTPEAPGVLNTLPAPPRSPVPKAPADPATAPAPPRPPIAAPAPAPVLNTLPPNITDGGATDTSLPGVTLNPHIISETTDLANGPPAAAPPAAAPPPVDTAPPPAGAPPATTPPASTPPGTSPANTAASDQAAADERIRQILAENAATKAIQIPTTTIDPNNNLIDQQISPNDSARLQEREGLADTQLGTIATMDRNAYAAQHAGEAIDPTVGDRLAKLRALQDTTLDKAVNGPDRLQMAKDQFAQFTKDSQPDYDLQRRQALNDAAAFGYTGSGRLNTAYGDLDLARERDMDSQSSRLQSAALEGTIGDRQNLLNTLSQYGNDEANYETQTREEQRKEREWQTAQGDADVAAQYAKGNYLTGAENDQRNVEVGQRTEQRGERNYQRDLSEQALADQIKNAQVNDQLTQSEFERDQARLNAGYAKDPSAAYESAANQAYANGQLSAEELKAILQYIAQQKQQPAAA